MTQYSAVGSYIIFEEVQKDLLGRLCRAGEFDATGVQRTVWLRVFDAPGIPSAAIGEKADAVSQIASIYRASNSAANPLLSMAGEVPLYAFDHMPSQPLDRIFAKVKNEGFPVPVDNALLIMEKIALALAGALAVDVGSKRLFHGFLLPAFVLVSNEGEAQVNGFGIGEEVLDVVDDPAARDAAAPFLAPEVLSARNASKKSDVYSLGAILFQLLTGDPLPQEPSERTQALAAPTMAYDYEPVPADIMGLLKKALRERPEERFSSAADFKKELDKLLYGGNYSPTTFNLALFMDRLFRNEIEAEEKARAGEDAVNVEPYLAPEPEPEPEPVPVVMTAQAAPSGGGGSGKWIGLAIAAIVVAAIGIAFVMKGGDSEAAAQQAEVIRQMQEQIQAREERDAQREKEMEDLQTKLEALQDQGDDQAKLEAEELRKKLRAAEDQKRREDQALEKQRRLLQQQQEQANVPTTAPVRPTPKPQPTATPVQQPTAATAVAVPTQVSALATPTPVPTPTPVRVTRNQMIERTDVDSAPQVQQSSKVSWPRAASRSRKRGVIILSALVNADGRVEEVKVLRADDQGFGIPDAAEDAVRKYTFRPAKKAGVDVKTWTTVTIPYNFQ